MTEAPSPDVRHLQRRIRVALGQEPGDLILSGGRLVNVFTLDVEPANVVVADGWIAGVGAYDWQARERIDLGGRVILPGLIDAHIHLESALLMPAEFARLAVPHGTTTVIADPHEIANVMGAGGLELLLKAGEGVPLDLFFMAPSCVPAVSWDTAGAELAAADLRRLLAEPRVLGLAEVMDFPAVLTGQETMLSKIVAARQQRRPIDGHAPGLGGRDLLAYAAAGIRSDHESSTADEGRAKAALGMMVQVREGSSAKNLDALLPLLRSGQILDWCLATDDIHPDDLLKQGHIDALLRRVVQGGVAPAQAVRHATLVPARHYGLADRGAVAPGYRADCVVVEDLEHFQVHTVIKDGVPAACEGRFLGHTSQRVRASQNTIHLGQLEESAFELKLSSPSCPVIHIVPDQITNYLQTRTVKRIDGCWAFDPEQDVALVASIERHQATGQVGLGLVSGFGLRREGVLGSSVAHDSHNLIIAGTNARDMLLAANALARSSGGWIVVADGAVAAQLPLPVAGLISTERAEIVCEQLAQVHRAAQSLGCSLTSPFGTLSFLALPVIPELRITTKGLFHVPAQQFVRL